MPHFVRKQKSALISCRLNFMSPCFHVALISCFKVCPSVLVVPKYAKIYTTFQNSVKNRQTSVFLYIDELTWHMLQVVSLIISLENVGVNGYKSSMDEFRIDRSGLVIVRL